MISQGQSILKNTHYIGSHVKENIIPVTYNHDLSGHFRTYESFNFSQRPANIEHSQFVQSSFPGQKRVVSPMNINNARSISNKKPEYIELGGSK